jgi:hypothetical protein
MKTNIKIWVKNNLKKLETFLKFVSN